MATSGRLPFLDRLRGLAAVVMLEVHVVHALLSPDRRRGLWFSGLNFFNGLVAPAGTPRELLERVRAEVAKAAAVAELRARFMEQGIELIASDSTEEFAAFLRKQVEEFAILSRQAGITAN